MATSFISVSTAAFDGYGFDVILPSLARCGVDNVEFAFIDGYVEAFTDSDFTQDFAHDLRSEMHRYGQQCRYFSGHIDLGLEDAAARIEARCRFAAWLGAGFVITNAAVREREHTFFKQADTLAAIAHNYGVRILLENPGNGVPNVFDSAGDAKALLERLDNDAFGINYDMGNLLSHVPHQDALDDARAALPLADHVHLKPCLRHGDGIDFVSFGAGDTQDAALARALLDQDKPFSLELPFRLHRDANAQPWRDEQLVALERIESLILSSLEELALLTQHQ